MGAIVIAFAWGLKTSLTQNLVADPNGYIENCSAVTEEQLAEYFESGELEGKELPGSNCKTYRANRPGDF